MTSNRDDPHAVLGVAPTATTAQVSHAYRELLRRHHPDTRTPEDDDAHDLALREVLDAYANLHHRTRRDGYAGHPPVRHSHEPENTQTEPIAVLGHHNPPLTPTWSGRYDNEHARPAPIALLIAFLEALPHDDL